MLTFSNTSFIGTYINFNRRIESPEKVSREEQYLEAFKEEAKLLQ